jgi:3-oxoacyl-[acyl-carrier protein] reductase
MDPSGSSEGSMVTVSDTATIEVSAERLKGRTAIITGGASGIGLASVRRFLAEGANVVSLDLDGDGAEASVASAGERGLGLAVDVGDADAVKRAVSHTIDRFGALDCYYNNAGVPMLASFVEDISDEDWQRVLNINLTAVFYAARVVIPHMKARGSGAFLVTASISGVRPRPRLASYTSAKGGAIALAKQLAVEVAEFGVRVNAICPVSTDTPMLSQFGVGDHITANATPMGRLGRPEEVAATAAWLASDDASFITGAAIGVDGGRSV